MVGTGTTCKNRGRRPLRGRRPRSLFNRSLASAPYIMPPGGICDWLAPFSSGFSATMHSVVNGIPRLCQNSSNRLPLRGFGLDALRLLEPDAHRSEFLDECSFYSNPKTVSRE